jgi:hypothetical protein
MDKNATDRIAELNNQETEQVVGGASANPAGNPAPRDLASHGGGFAGLDVLRGGITVSPGRAIR